MVKVCEILLQAQPLGYQDDLGKTALHYACEGGFKDVVTKLIK